jgi:hypothetical protein
MTNSVKLKWALAIVSLAVLIIVVAALAQQQQQPQATRGTRATGFRPGVVQGTVAQVDAAGSRMAITTPRGEVWVDVAAEAQIVRVASATATDLKVGQTVTVRGRPNAVSAVSVSLGEQTPPLSVRRGDSDSAPPAGGAFGRTAPAGGAPPTGGPARGEGARRGAGEQGAPFRGSALTTVTGKVSHLDPLTVTTEEGTTVTVSLDADTHITQNAPVALAEAQVGERVLASGERGQDDTLQAHIVRLGEIGLLGAGTRGPGGPGEGPGAGRTGRGNGPGAQDQAGEGQGARDAARGGRGSRGGGQGGQNRGAPGD